MWPIRQHIHTNLTTLSRTNKKLPISLPTGRILSLNCKYCHQERPAQAEAALAWLGPTLCSLWWRQNSQTDEMLWWCYDDTERLSIVENSYINRMSLPKVRVWIRYRARAIAGVKGNFRHSHVNNMGCRLCSQDSDETQEHLQLCEGTKFERRGLDLSDWRGLLDFWRRMKIKMATVTRVRVSEALSALGMSGMLPELFWLNLSDMELICWGLSALSALSVSGSVLNTVWTGSKLIILTFHWGLNLVFNFGLTEAAAKKKYMSEKAQNINVKKNVSKNNF